MGFAQWFWRLFLVYAGLIVVHVLLVTLALGPGWVGEENRAAFLWTCGGLTIAAGGLATWYCVRRIIEPLSALTRHVRAASAGGDGRPAIDSPDELGVLSAAFNQMQRDLARRVDELQKNSERLQTILGTMVEGVLAVGPDKTILLANEAGRQLLDFATPQPVGRPLLEVTRARPVYEAVTQALRSPAPVVTEFDSPGMQRRTLSLRATRLPGDPCPGVMVVLHDQSELRRLENLRRELVANVSHELKTPLAAIKAYAETLRLGAVNDPEHNVGFVQRIEEQAERLHQLILDMLQIARLEQGQETFEIGPVPMAELIDECGQQFAEVAAARQIVFHAEPPPDGIHALADEEGVRTILNNLVDNAIKYTPAGGQVTIRCRAGDQTVTLEIQDSGIGIAERDQARVFERFFRVDKARSREVGGTGLGLSIVKHLAQAFGGAVSLESAPAAAAPSGWNCRGRGNGTNVVFRSAKERPFAERKATNNGSRFAATIHTLSGLLLVRPDRSLPLENSAVKTLAHLVVAFAGLLAVCALTAIAADPAGFKTLAIGDAAPDFKLPGVDGKDYTLTTSQNAKLLLVVFTCNHCPTAQAYEERIMQAARRLQGPRRGAGGDLAERSAGRAARRTGLHRRRRLASTT